MERRPPISAVKPVGGRAVPFLRMPGMSLSTVFLRRRNRFCAARIRPGAGCRPPRCAAAKLFGDGVELPPGPVFRGRLSVKGPPHFFGETL